MITKVLLTFSSTLSPLRSQDQDIDTTKCMQKCIHMSGYTHMRVRRRLSPFMWGQLKYKMQPQPGGGRGCAGSALHDAGGAVEGLNAQLELCLLLTCSCIRWLECCCWEL